MPARLVVLGVGPRALGVLERIAARAALPEQAARLAATPLTIDLVDPHMPGAGRIWRAEESPLLLMNSRARDVTMFTDASVRCEGPVVPGPSLAAWAQGIREGSITAPTAGTERLAEIAALGPDDFAPRRVQALYLEWVLGQVLARLPATIRVRVHRAAATALRRDPARPGRWLVELEERSPLPADQVLLALGHTDARPGASRHALAAFARRHGGIYLPPSQASDAPLAQLDAGQDVIVRGMGLAAVDLVALLTEGRGGDFVPDPLPGRPGRLRYRPSGREPHLWLGSRRGVPYRSKIRDEQVPAGPRDLVHVTAQNLRAREDEQGRLGLREDVVPLIAAEIARAVPGAPQPDSADPDPLAWLDEPLAHLPADAGPAATRDAVLGHIAEDLAARTGQDTTAARALFQVLLRIAGALADLLPASRLRPEQDGQDLRWWHGLFSFVDSGPPPHRLWQLLALERAGIVTFLGPRLRVEADEEHGVFRARGGGGPEVSTSALVDAFLPEPTLARSANPLLRSLVDGPAAAGRESPTIPGRLEVDECHRVVGPQGAPAGGLWAVGPGTSELPIGAFARPGTNAPCFRRNDALAGRLLEAAATSRPPTAADPAAARTGPGLRRGGVRLGVLGAGRIGTALGRAAQRAGLEVRIASTRSAAELAQRLPGAAPVPVDLLAQCSDLVVLAVPLHAALALDPGTMRGAVVVDATNPWGQPDRDAIAAARAALAGAGATGAVSTSELVAAHLSGARVVKTFNHISYHDLEDRGRPPGHAERRALALAADDRAAAEAVADLLDRLGFDAVRIGPLTEGRLVEPEGGLFGGWRTRVELLRSGAALGTGRAGAV